MRAAASCFKGYSSATAVPIAATGRSAREAIAGIGARAADPACNAFPRGNGSVATATAVEMNRVGLRPTSSGSFPSLFAKASATNAPAFAQFPQTRRRFQHHHLGKEDRAHQPGL